MDHARGLGRQQRRRLDGVPVDHDRPRDRQKRDSGDQTEAVMTFDRRRFIRFVSAASTVAAASLLQACALLAPTAPAPKPPTSSRTVPLPNRFPLTGIKPDLAPSDDGLIDAAFATYPANPPRP